MLPLLKATGYNLGNSDTAEGLENFSPGLDQLCGPFLSVTSFSNLNIPDTAEGLENSSQALTNLSWSDFFFSVNEVIKVVLRLLYVYM